MNNLKDHPLILLLATGLLLGLYFPIGKLAANEGANPLLWAMAISLFPALVLGFFNARQPDKWRNGWGFAAVSGLVSYVIPNGITFAAIPHTGVGLMALMYACSPIVTAAFSMAFGVRPPTGKLLLGVGFGFVGAALIALSRGGVTSAEGFWVPIAFLVPLSLGVGNVYRTAFWPKDMAPARMAVQTNLAAVPPLAAVLLVTADTSVFGEALGHPWLFLAQFVTSTAMFTFFFRLQWVGGPTYLSQIGYVAAAFGLAAGVLVFGETYPLVVWAGVATIAAGVVVSNWR